MVLSMNDVSLWTASLFGFQFYSKALLIEVHLLKHEYQGASLGFFPALVQFDMLYLRVLQLEYASNHVRLFNCQE